MFFGVFFCFSNFILYFYMLFRFAFCFLFSAYIFICSKANMRVKIRGADDFLDVGQPVDYAKLMAQVGWEGWLTK